MSKITWVQLEDKEVVGKILVFNIFNFSAREWHYAYTGIIDYFSLRHLWSPTGTMVLLSYIYLVHPSLLREL